MVPTHKKNIFIILSIIAVVLVFENIILTINKSRHDKTVIGLKLYGQHIDSMDKRGLLDFTDRFFKGNKRDLAFQFEDQIFEIKKTDIDASYDPSTITNALLSIGRQGTFWQKLKAQNLAIFGWYDKKIRAVLSKDLLIPKMQQIGAWVYQEPIPPQPDFKNDINQTIPAKAGLRVDADKLALLIADNILYPPSKPLPIPTEPVPANFNEADLVPLRKEAMNLVQDAIQIKSAGQIFTLTSKDLLSLLRVVSRLDPKDPHKIKLVLRLDDTALNRKLDDFAKRIEEITNAEYNDHDARVAIYSQFYSGTRKLIEIPTGSNPFVGPAKKSGVDPRLASLLAAALPAAGTSGEKFVYLTFDDGPNDIYHPLILDILKKYNVKATFFLVGQNSKKYEDITKRTIAEGHTIGDHSLTHPFLPKLSANAIFKEINETKSILTLINNNNEVYLFRPPYGGINKDVSADVTDLRLRMYLWDVDPRDWSDPPVDELINRVLSHIRNGSDILMHSNHLVTVKALPKIIEGLQAQGYSFKLLQ